MREFQAEAMNEDIKRIGKRAAPGVFAHFPTPHLSRLSGVQLLQKSVRGELPLPTIFKPIDFRVTKAIEGQVVLQSQPIVDSSTTNKFFTNSYAMTLLDCCLSFTVFSTLPRGRTCVTSELTLNFIAPLILQRDLFVAEGNIIAVDGATGFAEARLADTKENLYATATAYCSIIDN